MQGLGAITLPQAAFLLGKNFGKRLSQIFEAPRDGLHHSKNCAYAYRRLEKT
jgi:hypothetical protein